MTISFGDPWDNEFKFQEQQQLQYKIHVFIVIVIFYNCLRVMVDPLKIFWVLTNSTYLGEHIFSLSFLNIFFYFIKWMIFCFYDIRKEDDVMIIIGNNSFMSFIRKLKSSITLDDFDLSFCR